MQLTSRTLIATMVVLGAADLAAAQPVHVAFPGGTPGPPIYASVGSGFLPHTEELAVVFFYRSPACVPADFNLLDFLDFTPAFPGGPPLRSSGGLNTELIAGLPEQSRALYVQAFTTSLSTVFLVATGIGVVGWLLTWLVPELPLRETVAHTAGEMGMEVGETFPMPGDHEAVEQVPDRTRGTA